MTVEKPKPKQFMIVTNHNRSRQRHEPITIPSNYLKLARSAGKITRTWRDWFCFSLVENWRESFKPITKRINRNNVITFGSHLKTALLRTNAIPDWRILVLTKIEHNEIKLQVSNLGAQFRSRSYFGFPQFFMFFCLSFMLCST